MPVDDNRILDAVREAQRSLRQLAEKLESFRAMEASQARLEERMGSVINRLDSMEQAIGEQSRIIGRNAERLTTVETTCVGRSGRYDDLEERVKQAEGRVLENRDTIREARGGVKAIIGIAAATGGAVGAGSHWVADAVRGLMAGGK